MFGLFSALMTPVILLVLAMLWSINRALIHYLLGFGEGVSQIMAAVLVLLQVFAIAKATTPKQVLERPVIPHVAYRSKEDK